MLEQYVSLPIPNPNANIHSEEEWKGISREIEEIIVDSGCGNDSKDIILDFSEFRKLKSIVVGNYSFKNAILVEICDLDELEKVIIGENSMQSNQCEFTLKNCNAVEELVIGQGSFISGTMCLIEDNESLKEIRMGESRFYHLASSFQNGYMELKSEEQKRVSPVDLPSLTRAVFGRDVCTNCLSARFESGFVDSEVIVRSPGTNHSPVWLQRFLLQ